MIFKLAWRNIWRQPRRTLLNAVAIMLVTGIMIFLPSFQDGSYRSMIRASVGVLDGYGQLQHSDYLDNPSIRNSFSVGADLRKRLSDSVPGGSYEERATAFALLSSEARSFGAQVVGVEPDKAVGVSNVPKNISKGRYLGVGNEIILGEGLARNLKLNVGDSLTLIGSGRDGSFAADALQVVGIFQSGIPDIDRTVAEIPISRFDEVFTMSGQRHAIVFNQEGSKFIENHPESLLAENLEYRSWKELQPSLLKAIYIDIGSAAMMYLILIIVICFSLLNSVLMSTLERTREFGMMLALGIKPGLLAKVVWIENALILVIGLCAGCLLGAGITLWFSKEGINFASAEEIFAQFGLSSTLYPNLTFITFFLGPAVIAILALLLGLYPSIRAQRLFAVDAMKAV